MTDLNDPSSPLSGLRQPRLRVLLNGEEEGGCLSVGVNNNNHFSADTFEAHFITDALYTQTLEWWSKTDTILVEVQTAFGPGQWTPIFAGEVDNLDANPISREISVHGRDLSRRLRDAKTQETFQNQTSSEVVETLARRRGLNPVVKPTTTLVTRYYGADHDHLTGDQFTKTTTEWDLLVYLAEHEGYDLFMQGYDLHFEPSPDDTGPFFVIRLDDQKSVPRMNVMHPRLERSLTLAKDIEVWVRSWSPGAKAGFTKKSGGKAGKTGGGRGGGRDSNGAQRIVIVRPNLSEDAAQKLADAKRSNMTKHERLFSFELPGDPAFTTRQVIRLEGTRTSWDQVYFVSSVTRHIDRRGGYTMQVHCKNHSPDNETIPA